MKRALQRRTARTSASRRTSIQRRCSSDDWSRHKCPRPLLRRGQEGCRSRPPAYGGAAPDRVQATTDGMQDGQALLSLRTFPAKWICKGVSLTWPAHSANIGRQCPLIARFAMRYTVKDKLKAKVRASKAPVFLRADFAHLGHGRQVSRALTELERERVLVRAGYGVYTRPVGEFVVD